ncbi:MAG: tRNA pseudouridine(38-40) synthase TruA [Gemmatimonadota bacterium]|nr:tRNA pseudouridine(38-40) synthase TruA [Gemmatimonadota bacterium]
MSENETRFKLTLHYDGSAFHGWQVQPGQPTVQGAVEAVISRITGEPRTVTGAGRTDTGVHATGQVASVTVPGKWTSRTLVRALNGTLPAGVWVQDATPADPAFHPRFDAVARSYAYRVGTAPEASSPFHRPWCWPLGRPLDMDAACRAAEAIRGEHEFHAFAKAGQPKRGLACRVMSARWRPWEELGAVFEITANRFLHRMVRYFVGTMVDIALGRRKEEDMVLLLNNDPAMTTSPPAPPEGLFLTGVEYPVVTRGKRNVNRTLHSVK